jgi:hypothetical protein
MSYVFFQHPSLDLKDAASALKKRGIHTVRREEELLIVEDGQLVFAMRLARGMDIQKMAAEIGQGTVYAERLARCDARFQIRFRETNKVLQDPQDSSRNPISIARAHPWLRLRHLG